MPRIPTFKAGPTRVAAAPSPERMGAVGRAVSGFGQQVAQIGKEVQEATDNAWHEKNFSDLQRRQMKTFKQLQSQHEDPNTFTDTYMEQYQKDADELMKSAPSNSARKMFSGASTRLGTQMFQQGITHEIAQVKAGVVSDLTIANQNHTNIVRENPGELQVSLETVMAGIAGARPQLTPAESTKLIRDTVTGITYAGGQGEIDANPVAALEMFREDPMWQEQTTPSQYSALLNGAERAIAADKASRIKQNKVYIQDAKDYISFKESGRGLDQPRPEELSPAAIRSILPPEIAGPLIEEIGEAERIAPEMSVMQSGTPVEAAALIGDRTAALDTSSEDFADQAREAGALQAAYAQRVKALKTDAAAYTATYSPAVQEASEALVVATATGDPEEIAQATQDMATMQLQEQRRMGVPESQQRVLTKAQADIISTEIQRKSQAGETAVDTLNQLEATYGPELYPKVLTDIGDKLPAAYTVIPGMIDRSAATLLAEGATFEGGPQKILDTVGVKMNDVKENVITHLDAFRQTIEGGTSRAFAGGSQYFDKVTNAAVMLAAMYVRDGKSAGEAAELAADKVANEMYNFQGTYRIPAERDEGLIISGANEAMQDTDTLGWEIDTDAIQSVYGIETFAPDESRIQILRAIETAGVVWVTSPDDSGLIMTTADGLPLPKVGGGSITRSWEELEQLGLNRQKVIDPFPTKGIMQ